MDSWSSQSAITEPSTLAWRNSIAALCRRTCGVTPLRGLHMPGRVGFEPHSQPHAIVPSEEASVEANRLTVESTSSQIASRSASSGRYSKYSN
jgi:hypothetical protein